MAKCASCDTNYSRNLAKLCIATPSVTAATGQPTTTLATQVNRATAVSSQQDGAKAAIDAAKETIVDGVPDVVLIGAGAGFILIVVLYVKCSGSKAADHATIEMNAQHYIPEGDFEAPGFEGTGYTTGVEAGVKSWDGIELSPDRRHTLEALTAEHTLIFGEDDD